MSRFSLSKTWKRSFGVRFPMRWFLNAFSKKIHLWNLGCSLITCIYECDFYTTKPFTTKALRNAFTLSSRSSECNGEDFISITSSVGILKDDHTSRKFRKKEAYITQQKSSYCYANERKMETDKRFE